MREGMNASPKKEMLLHVCCAPCAAHCIEQMKSDWNVVLFFSNSNIFPEAEYYRRLREVERIAEHYGCALVEDEYNHKDWRNFIAGLENEPEKGARCLKCFEYNLRRAAQRAEQKGCEAFTTTLTISPHKSFEAIAAIGSQHCKFLPINFKKKDGFRRSLELSHKFDLYRQVYCGCEFSIRSDRLP